MGRNFMGHKLNYINGITLASSKKFFKFYFKEFYHSSKGDKANWRYNIFVLKKAKIEEDGKLVTYKIEDCFDLEEFKQYWGKGFNVVMVEYENA